MTIENPQLPDEIKNRVLTENTAQGVLNHLKALESNRARMRTRWVWELLQNARDTSAASVSIECGHEEITFRHDGAKFKMDEVAHLIYHGSTKAEDEGALGKYGSGFLTTHLLSPTIEVSGQLNNGQSFEFDLKREVGSVKALSGSMDQAWDDFNDSLSGVSTSDNFTTQFRYPIGDRAIDAVKKGIAMLKNCAPFVVAFNKVFSCINIKSPDETTSFEVTERTPISQDGLQEITVLENGNGSTKRRKYLLAESGETFVAVPMEPTSDGNKTLIPINNTPRLFLGFPLIGTENFSFPAVINSFEFTPTEDRDGVYLGTGSNEENRKNQAVIEDACKLLISLVQFAASSGWRNTYILANVPAIPKKEWLNEDWLRETLKEEFIGKARQVPAVTNENGDIKAPEDAKLPLAETAIGVEALWDLLDSVKELRDALPRRNEAVGWWNAIKSWAVVHGRDPISLFDEAIDGENLASYIEEETRGDGDWGRDEDLQSLLHGDTSAVEWLNQLHVFLYENQLRKAVSEYHLVLDQAGFLDKLSNLHRDNDIAEKLKDIAELLGWNIRQKLRDTRLSSLENEVGKGDWNSEYVVRELITKLKERENDPDDDFAKASVGLFKWIVDQADWYRLRDFPVFAKQDDSGDLAPFRLKQTEAGDDPFLAPVWAWTKDLQPFSDLFPRRYILADDFFNAVSDSDVWQMLDDQGFLKRNVIITKDVYFSTFLPDEPLSEESDHETTEKVAVTNVAFFSTQDIGVIDRVRGSQRLARIFWRFLTKWLAVNDYEGLEVKEACCECGKTHQYYQAEWLEPLVKRRWVPLRGDRRDKATAQSLADLLRNSGWELSSLKENPAAVKLLEAIGVTQFDLTREFVAENPETRQELDNAFADILATAGENISHLNHARDYIVALKNDENLPKIIEDRQRQKQMVQKNQKLGQLAEKLVRESLESEDFTVRREPIGSDFEIEHDSVKDEEGMSIELARGNQSWLVEVKATQGQEVRMTTIQARKAVERGDRFLLCVVPVGNVEPELDTVRHDMRFVKNIGGRVGRLCNDLNRLEELRKDITADASSGVQVEIVSGTARVRVANSVWENDGFKLADLAKRLSQ